MLEYAYQSRLYLCSARCTMPFSDMPELKTPPSCSYEAPLSNKDMIQLSQGEIYPDSPWLLSCSSTTPSSPSLHVFGVRLLSINLPMLAKLYNLCAVNLLVLLVVSLNNKS